MNVVFISPHFPPQFFLFCTALRRRGVTVLGIGDAPEETLRPELRQALAAYYFVPDMNRHDDMLRAVGWLIHRHGRIDRIDSLNEHWLAVEARLREDFNVPGPRTEDTSRNQSKMAMKERFRAANVPCTEGARLTSRDLAWAFAERHGYPLVFKPDIGVGAARTFRVDDDAQLARALEEPPEGYVIERFERGRLTTFDGLAARDGRIVFCLSLKYSSGIMEVVNERLPIHYYTRRDMPAALESAGRRVVEAFGVRERFFHVEFFETPQGEFRALEVNVRPPGGFTTDLMNYSCDIDVYDLWARALTGDPALNRFTYERRWLCGHVARRDGVRYRLSPEQLRAQLGPALLMERRMPEAFAGAMGDDAWFLKSADEESLLEAVAKVEARA